MMRTLLRVLAVALAVLVAALVVTWAPDKPVAELTERWAPAPSTFIQVAGMSVHVRDEGPRDDPMPIVLLHGTSASLHTWNGWVERLSATRRVIRFDLPGFGLTGPSPTHEYHMQAYADFVAAMLDALELDQVTLGGNSLGGHIAWETALAYPERVSQLILVDSGGYPLNPESMPIGFRIALIPGLNRIMEFTLPRFMVAASVRDVYGDPSRVTPELIDRYYDLTLRAGNRQALRERFEQTPLMKSGAAIAGITQPTLILWGGQDRLIEPKHAHQFDQDIANSELVMFEQLGHVPQEEDADETVAVVERWLSAEK
ncbi:MAG: alpha/beta hydrolase [Gammaproteobacteria bacterium]|nr:alpha/beta hydrolase [Gammaproteobacteria bacterium]MBQ0774227.1 alpha/beta hydrolase [Gammaproteobacteria bacterium]